MLLAFWGATPVTGHAQREQQIQPAREQQSQPQAEDAPYSRKFFAQLRGVFGRFRDSDLQRAFEKAQPIQCSELVNDKGEWRTVAFFNEKRELGDWYRTSFDEVKNDLTVFIFKGVCRGERGPVQLTTKFPVTETVDAYNRGAIPLEEIDINVNAPVRASFEPASQAYSFDLPYLFLISRQDDESLYSLQPPLLGGRDKYATDVTDHWDCKSVTAENVTYQFLLCRTMTMPRNPAARRENRAAPFGASAYFILSDGREASSAVKLTFSDDKAGEREIEDASRKAPTETPEVHDSVAWEQPASDEKILDIVRDEFRLRFNPQTWSGRIGSPQVLAGRQLISLDSAQSNAGMDYCMWLPASTGAASRLLEPAASEPVGYLVTVHDRDSQIPTSITIEMSPSGTVSLGKLQCIFPRASSAVGIGVDRWTSIVGSHVILEVRP